MASTSLCSDNLSYCARACKGVKVSHQKQADVSAAHHSKVRKASSLR